MKKYNEKHRKIIETFLNERFSATTLTIQGHHHTHANGDWIRYSGYSLGDTLVLNTYRTNDKDQATFAQNFILNFGKWFGFKYKRHYLKDWLLKNYLKNFDLADKIHV